MVGNSTHWNRFSGLIRVSGCQSDFQHSRRADSILKKHLVKVPEAKEKELVRMLVLDLQILANHGGVSFHRGPYLSSFNRPRLGSFKSDLCLNKSK